MLALAARAAIEVCDARPELVGKSVVLLVRRFDRRGLERVPFLSATSLLDAADGQQRSYVELFDALRQIGSQVATDGPQLWRRLAFNILASNLDDHLRNHAILYDGAGWRMTPAYDLNPVPAHIKSRELTTAIDIDGDPTASIELAMEAAPEFLLNEVDARRIAGEMARVVATWRDVAAQFAVRAGEIDRMATAFEHDDADRARRWGRGEAAGPVRR